jgi:hypothetical protein
LPGWFGRDHCIGVNQGAHQLMSLLNLFLWPTSFTFLRSLTMVGLMLGDECF